jgi:hypothetical protein
VIVVVARVAIGILDAARQDTADVAVPRVAGDDRVVDALLNHVAPVADQAHLADRAPCAVDPGLLDDAPLAPQGIVVEPAMSLRMLACFTVRCMTLLPLVRCRKPRQCGRRWAGIVAVCHLWQ